MNDLRRGEVFRLYPIIGPPSQAWVSWLYLKRMFLQTGSKSDLPCSTVHLLLVSTWLYWNLHSREKVEITFLKRASMCELKQINSCWWTELQSHYKAIQWRIKLNTKKRGIMQKVDMGQCAILALGWGGDNYIYLVNSFCIIKCG